MQLDEAFDLTGAAPLALPVVELGAVAHAGVGQPQLLGGGSVEKRVDDPDVRRHRFAEGALHLAAERQAVGRSMAHLTDKPGPRQQLELVYLACGIAMTVCLVFILYFELHQSALYHAYHPVFWRETAAIWA